VGDFGSIYSNESSSLATHRKMEVSDPLAPSTTTMVVDHPPSSSSPPPPPPYKKYRTKYRMPKDTARCVNTGRVAVVARNSSANRRRPTSTTFPKPQSMHNTGDADDIHLSSSLHLVELPADSITTTIIGSTTAAAIAPIYWPCLVFSTSAHASKMHYKYYSQQVEVQLQITKQVARDLLNSSLQHPASGSSSGSGGCNSSSSSNNNNTKQTFRVVLPLRDAKGCYQPLYNVDCSSALNWWGIMTRYRRELNQSRHTNPALYAALLELERLLTYEVASDEETEEETLKRKGGHTQDEIEMLKDKSFKFGSKSASVSKSCPKKLTEEQTFYSTSAQTKKSTRLPRHTNPASSMENVAGQRHHLFPPVSTPVKTAISSSVATTTTVDTRASANVDEEEANQESSSSIHKMANTSNMSPALFTPARDSQPRFNGADSESASLFTTTESPRKKSTLQGVSLPTTTCESEKKSAANDAQHEVHLPGDTVREKLQACLSALRTDGKDSVVAVGNLQESHNEIKKFLHTVIASKGRNGGRAKALAPILYICGAPGTGKTSSTTQLCHEAICEAKKNLQRFEKAPRMSYVNCSILQNLSKTAGLDKIKKDMKVTTFARPKNDASAAAAILVLDEVDTLLGRSKQSEELLKTLSSWSQDKSTVLCLIGISNAINNKKVARMVEYGMVSFLRLQHWSIVDFYISS
jgi:Cdc6-like AAA superfamily ATPase